MATMVKLQTVTVGSGGAATIDFTSIPQTYTDLKIVLSARTDRSSGGSNDYTKITFNGSNTGYSIRSLYGDGATAGSNTYSGNWLEPFGLTSNTATASVFGNLEVYISNYTSSNNKSVSMDGVAETNATTQYIGLSAGLWSNTAAITSIKMIPFYGTLFLQYTTATLYGVKNVTTATGTGKATGGDQVYTDGTYWYHVYRTVGVSSFTPLTSLTCDYLVVAGGGAGGEANSGGSSGGGGGAGGIRCTVGATGGGGSLESALSLSATAYTVTVGNGGTRGGSFGTKGGNGSNSAFASITATGGGGGGTPATTANSGGSGGGDAYGGTGIGTGTSGQGYAGGTHVSSVSNFPGGGGGGASAVGANGTSTVGGAGGNGITTSISGISTTYGGGGGGGVYSGTAGNSGAGGTGGGGKGAYQNVAAVAGTANTGGGGGGGARETGGNIIAAAAGGSGIVIVRYAV